MKTTRNTTIESWGYKYKSETPLPHTKVYVMPIDNYNTAVTGIWGTHVYYGAFKTIAEAFQYVVDNHLTEIDDEGFAFEY